MKASFDRSTSRASKTIVLDAKELTSHELSRINLANLTQLWRKYGEGAGIEHWLSGSGCYVHQGWPYRCWIEHSSHSDVGSGMHLLFTQLPKRTVIPVACFEDFSGSSQAGVQNANLPNCLPLWGANQWEPWLLKNHWACSFEQTAMALVQPNRDTLESLYSQSRREGFDIRPVSDHQDLAIWINVASEAFGYDIDSDSIKPLMNDSKVKLLMGWYEQQPVATALLFKSEAAVGIHQMGVIPAAQGQGIARVMMARLLVQSAQWHCAPIVLQASAAGLPLYERLGFEPLFIIKNYCLAP